jgi:uroporphyrinogen-III synthase
MYCVGEESAAPVRRAGFEPLIPREATGAAGLARYILERAETDHVRSVIFLRGDRSLPDLPDILRAGGLEVFGLEVYRTRFLDADVTGLTTWLRRGDPVAAAFFSPSGVIALERLLHPDMRVLARERVNAVARGETTARALEERGYGRIFRPGALQSFESVALEALRTLCEARS